MERGTWLWMVGLALGVACGDKRESDDDDDGGGGDDSAAPSDSGSSTGGGDTGGGTGGDPGGIPADPRPLTVTVTGATSQSLVFDQVTCTHPLNSSNFRIFWRGSGHVFVLKAEVLGDYTGPGTYSSADTSARASLQEEAGGSGFYFTADAAQGDTVTFTMEAHDVDAAEAWGTFTVTGMHGSDGALPLEPSSLPIWCPVVG